MRTHLQRLQTVRHDFGTLVLPILIQEALKWRTDHDTVAAESRSEVYALLGHPVVSKVDRLSLHLGGRLVYQISMLNTHDSILHRVPN